MIPPIDPASILMALASATLFTLAIVYVLRSKSARIETLAGMRESAAAGRVPGNDQAIFSDVLVETPFAAQGLVLSVTLHVVVLLGTPLLPYLFPESLSFDFRKYNVKIVEFRIPKPLLYSAPQGASDSHSQPAAKTAGRRRMAHARIRNQQRALHARASKPAAVRPATPRRRPARTQVAKARPQAAPAVRVPERPRFQLQLPGVLHATSKDVIIQPDQPPEVAISVPQPLPSAFLWAQGPAPIDPSQVVGAPPKPEPLQFSLPHSTPVIQPPNHEVAISDLQIASGPLLTFRPPQLPVPPANVAPVRMPAPLTDTPGELPASTLPGGNPVNLIALMNTPAPPAPSYVTEVGQRLPDSQPPASASEDPNAPSSAAPESPSGNASSANEDLPPALTATTQTEVVQLPLSGAAASLGTVTSAGTAPTVPGAASTAAAGSAGTGAAGDTGVGSEKHPGPATGAGSAPAGTTVAAGNADRPGAPDAASRAGETPAKGTFADLLKAGAGARGGEASRTAAPPGRTWPTGGNLGVVIVQQSAEESILEGGEALTGQPVYTVYFDVPGAPRRWILQYCVPGSVATKSYVTNGDGVIHIIPKRSVQPPFPLDRIPLDLQSYQGDAERLVVYALVDERGETVNVRVVRGTGQQIDTTAVDTLKRWAFRPAMRGDTPVAVEALFGIPLR